VSGDHDHDGHGRSELSEMDLRVRALESLLVEKGYVVPAALDRLIETYETKIGRATARVVAKAWVDPAFRAWLLADASAATASLGFNLGSATCRSSCGRLGACARRVLERDQVLALPARIDRAAFCRTFARSRSTGFMVRNCSDPVAQHLNAFRGAPRCPGASRRRSEPSPNWMKRGMAGPPRSSHLHRDRPPKSTVARTLGPTRFWSARRHVPVWAAFSPKCQLVPKLARERAGGA